MSQGSVATLLCRGGKEKLCRFKAEFGALCICVVSIYLNAVSKLLYPNQTNCDFSNFQNGRCRHLGFLKL